MKTALYILLIALISVSCKEKVSQPIKLTYNFSDDIPQILKPGKHDADIMDGIKMPPGVAEVQAKIMEAIEKNREWFISYTANATPGEPLVYHENFGVTKEEYELYLEGIHRSEAMSTGRESLTIHQSNNMLSFNGTGKLYLFDSIRIDLNSKKVYFKEFTLPLEDTIRVTDEKNALKSKWFGYKFSFSDPANIDMRAFNDLPNLNIKSVKLTVGNLEKNDRTWIDFAFTIVENGEKTIEINIPVILLN